MTARPDLSDALNPLRDILAADGYGVEVIDGAPVQINVVAIDGACEDCLVPESIMRPMIADMLQDKGIGDDWALSMPTGTADH